MIYILEREPLLSLFLKGKKKVIGVESVPDAIKDAKTNAVRNNIDNCEFYVGDMKVVTMILSLNMDILMLSSQTHQEMECTKT
jgi:tRNA/tmRNA/rRNA uracil-C5-methylase (TrmA/RlmC/RlmD family)